ncbi:MAG: tam [Acidimicrobiaceae bacterium]|nr:tam [Acidimicrobiaceae bacterium]
MATAWDPDQYLQYASERERPFWDLVARVPARSPGFVVDLGCGPGTATAGLLEHWPEAAILGIDSSEAMLEQAKAHEAPPRLRFERGDIATWAPDDESVDVILSNAAFQWIPGHSALFSRWLAALAPRGALAFQVPANFDSPSHTLLRQLATSGPWRDRLAGVAERPQIPEPQEYYRQLTDLGANAQVWETTYYHVLTGTDPVLEWMRGTGLRPFLGQLMADEVAPFTRSYAEALREAYPPSPSGETLYPFRRVFVVAGRS